MENQNQDYTPKNPMSAPAAEPIISAGNDPYPTPIVVSWVQYEPQSNPAYISSNNQVQQPAVINQGSQCKICMEITGGIISIIIAIILIIQYS